MKLKTDAEINLKCIPYLFFTTTSNHRAVLDAYSASAQGFFTMPNSYDELKEQISVIMDYWIHCTAPNNFLPSVSNLNSNGETSPVPTPI